MKSRTPFALFAVLLLGFQADSLGHAAKSEKRTGRFDVEVLKDIPYREDKDTDPERHRLDLYLPMGQKGFPVLVFAHGGGWSKGDRKSFAKPAEALARGGVGVASVGYRLTPQVRHPAHAQDVARAFAWVHGNIARHGGRPDRLFLGGHSAGGHLAALVATDASYLKAEGLSPGDIKGVVPVSGLYAIPPGRWTRVFGTEEDIRRNASPIAHIEGKHPPFLILYADKDGKGFGEMAEDYCRALKKTGCDSECMKVANRGHQSIISKMADQGDPAAGAVLEFVERHSGRRP